MASPIQWTLFGLLMSYSGRFLVVTKKHPPAVTCDVNILYVLDALDAPGRSKRFVWTPLFDIRKSLKFQKTIT